ncbi:alpha/beta hydrolase [Marinomonas algicola]|jgi:phospholipase/carboxylesterase|uniref:alpha/beta hydrolase n=1 Tax=Marinomonas algicola TaxID=2773454 RepID=UPI00174A16E2|nr:dienelactone hydrolase family protein [Marinomonas algicola]
MQELECVVVETSSSIDSAVIWLHGLGSDGYDFQPIVKSLSLPEALGVRFIFPHAPIRPVTINGGMEMRAWYDILEMTIERKVDSKNIAESCAHVQAIIDAQIASGMASERIVLAGFSQGGVIAYKLGLTTQSKLAGIMALSTYLVEAEALTHATENVNGSTSILIHHGSEDPVVPLQLGTTARETLLNKSYNVAFKSYNMPHSVCPEQIGDISNWLQRVLLKPL